jgi:hypothetical protein
MRLVWVVIPFGIIALMAVLLIPQMYEDKQTLTLSKESCESFDGLWKEPEFECWNIELEECTGMKRTFELRPGYSLEYINVCK